MPSSLHLLTPDGNDALSRPEDAEELECALSAGLERLQSVCDARGRGDRRLEVASCNLAWRIARLIVAADMAEVRLPRGYVARTRSSEPYLAKYARESSDSISAEAEPAFVLTRKDSIVARMEPGARKLSYAQVLEFKRDLDEGLIEEIATFIENCNAREDEAAASLNKLLAAPEPGAATRKLSELGRRKRPLPASTGTAFSLSA